MSAKNLLVMLAVMFFATTAAFALDDYSLVYDDTGMAGGFSYTGDYTVVDMVFSMAVEGGRRDSTDYSMTSITGDTSDETTSVECWMLYDF